MSLEDKIIQDIKNAMLAKEKEKLEALRAVKAAILLEKTNKGSSGAGLSEQTEIQILKKLVKQRKESATIYTDKGRDELAQTELFQAEIIESYLPEQLSEAEVESIINKVIEETGATSLKDMGKVMGLATKQLAGKADNSMVAAMVKKILGE